MAEKPAKAPDNHCPFGCRTPELDEHGYCRHLIGFTLPGNEKFMEPRVPRFNLQDPPQVVGYFVDGKQKGPVPKNAQLERLTVCSRVYHKNGIPDYVNVDGEPAEAELEEAVAK